MAGHLVEVVLPKWALSFPRHHAASDGVIVAAVAAVVDAHLLACSEARRKCLEKRPCYAVPNQLSFQRPLLEKQRPQLVAAAVVAE